MQRVLYLVLILLWRVSGEEFRYQECTDASIWKSIKKSNKEEKVFEERFLKEKTGYTLLPDVLKNDSCAEGWKLCVTFIGNIKHCGICLNPHVTVSQFYDESQCAEDWESQYENRGKHGMKRCDGKDKEWAERTWGELFQGCLREDKHCFCDEEGGYGSCQVVEKQYCTGCIHDSHIYKSNPDIFANCTSGSQDADGIRFFFPDHDNSARRPKSRIFPRILDTEASTTTTTIQDTVTSETFITITTEAEENHGNVEGVIMVAVSSCLGTLVIVLVVVIIGMRIRKKRKESKIARIDYDYYYYGTHAGTGDNDIYYENSD